MTIAELDACLSEWRSINPFYNWQLLRFGQWMWNHHIDFTPKGIQIHREGRSGEIFFEPDTNAAYDWIVMNFLSARETVKGLDSD